MPELWTPVSEGAHEAFVDRVHRAIAKFSEATGVPTPVVEVELADTSRWILDRMEPEPGFGMITIYVQNAKDNHFDQRMVKLAKRSESVMVIADGLKPGETIALGDPTAKKNDKNEKSSGSSKSVMPTAGGKGK